MNFSRRPLYRLGQLALLGLMLQAEHHYAQATKPQPAPSAATARAKVETQFTDKQLAEVLANSLDILQRREFDQLADKLSIHPGINVERRQQLQNSWREFIEKRVTIKDAEHFKLHLLACEQGATLAHAVLRLSYKNYSQPGICFAMAFVKQADGWKLAPGPDSFANINLPINLQNRELIERQNRLIAAQLEQWSAQMALHDDVELFKSKQLRFEQLSKDIKSPQQALQLLHRSIFEKNVFDVFALTSPQREMLAPANEQDYAKWRKYYNNLSMLFDPTFMKEFVTTSRNNTLLNIMQDSVVNLLTVRGQDAHIYSIKTDRYSDRKESFFRTDLQVLEQAGRYSFIFRDNRFRMTGELMAFNDEKGRIEPIYDPSGNLPECPRSEFITLLQAAPAQSGANIDNFCRLLEQALQSKNLLELFKLHNPADLKDNEMAQLRRMCSTFGHHPHCQRNTNLEYLSHQLAPGGKQAVIFLKGFNQPNRIFPEISHVYALLDDKSGNWYLYNRYGSDGDINLAAIEKVKNDSMPQVKQSIVALNDKILPCYVPGPTLPTAPTPRQVEELIARMCAREQGTLITLQKTQEGKKQVESSLRYLLAEFNKQDSLLGVREVYAGKHMCAASVEVKSQQLPQTNVLVLLLPHEKQWRILADNVLYASSNKGRSQLNTRNLKSLQELLPAAAHDELKLFLDKHNKFYRDSKVINEDKS